MEGRGESHDARKLSAGEDVVVETILLVPHAVLADPVHRVAYPKKMLHEFGRQVLIGRIALHQLHADFEHVLTEERHPCSRVGLFEIAPGRQWRAAIEDANVVEAQEAALEKVLAEPVLAVCPPSEIQRERGEDACQELQIRVPGAESLRRANLSDVARRTRGAARRGDRGRGGGRRRERDSEGGKRDWQRQHLRDRPRRQRRGQTGQCAEQ